MNTKKPNGVTSPGTRGAPKLQAIDIEGPAGRLEAIVMTPAGKPCATAILCHAHPLHGGMMHYKLLYRVAKLLQRYGLAVLRFNFRGVGRSQGLHDEGIGEQEDLRAVIRSLEELYPSKPLLLGGFSFGSVMAARVGLATEDVAGLLLMGFPVGRVSNTRFMTHPSYPPVPALFVQGELDEFGAVAALGELTARLSPPGDLEIIEGADHFFTDKLSALESRIGPWIERHGDRFGVSPRSDDGTSFGASPGAEV